MHGFLTFLLLVFVVFETTASKERTVHSRNAYVTMLYMGTPRDYEFYVATRMMIRSLVRLDVEADLIVIASLEVLLRWVHALYHLVYCQVGQHKILIYSHTLNQRSFFRLITFQTQAQQQHYQLMQHLQSRLSSLCEICSLPHRMISQVQDLMCLIFLLFMLSMVVILCINQLTKRYVNFCWIQQLHATYFT